MPNFSVVLKNEISRLSRREIRKEAQPLRKIAASHRREIAALKRTIAALERRTRQLAKVATTPQSRASVESAGKPIRFVAKGLRSLRERLGLSAPELARVLSVSTQSIYNWEHKKATPRKEQLDGIVALRAQGRKEVRQLLAASKQEPKRKAVKRARSRKK